VGDRSSSAETPATTRQHPQPIVETARLVDLLEDVRAGRASVQESLARLAGWPVADLVHTRLDTQRELRCGFPEVVYGAGKTPAELAQIAREIAARHGRLLVTRASAEGAAALLEAVPGARHHVPARAVSYERPRADGPAPEGLVLVLSAGTSDAPVAAEAALTARMLGARVEELPDVGVAGLHRLLAHAGRLRAARALVVVAGMEGALPSVVGGLVQRPVIAVPTSVGYGASLGGLAALFAMLNSCAPNVSVVNIDNGFGAGYVAALVNRAATATAPVDPAETP
jgi:NCAIR mutase (PurE)-related protein